MWHVFLIVPRPFASPSFFTTSSSSSSSTFLLITTAKFPQTAKVPRKIRLYRANELLSNLKQNFQRVSPFAFLLPSPRGKWSFPEEPPRNLFHGVKTRGEITELSFELFLRFARKTNIKIYASFYFYFFLLRDYKEAKRCCDWIINSLFSCIHLREISYILKFKLYYKSRITIAKNIILIFIT